MKISKYNFLNWTRCPQFHNLEIDEDILCYPESEARKERLSEMIDVFSSSVLQEDSPAMMALLYYYSKVESEALTVARRHFHGRFTADCRQLDNQKHFECAHGQNIYHCYVDIFNETDNQINVIEVKATTDIKFSKIGTKNIDRYSDEGRYSFDLAFQKYVIDHALEKSGDKRTVNYFLAVLNSNYVYNGDVDASGNAIYNAADGMEPIIFIPMNDIVEQYQELVESEMTKLDKWSTDIETEPVFYESDDGEMWLDHFVEKFTTLESFPLGPWCSLKKLGECVFLKECNHLGGLRTFEEKKDSSHVDIPKRQEWLNHLEYPIYHLNLEAFPCPLPRFRGEKPYTPSCFAFSLHIEREPGVCDIIKDNVLYLNEYNATDERESLIRKLIDSVEFLEDGTLKGTMLTQNTSFVRARLDELACIFPNYEDKLKAIAKKSEELIDDSRKSIRNHEEAYVAYINYGAGPDADELGNKNARKKALRRFCRQCTWTMVKKLHTAD